jgi:hydroxymethylglutaryl-CoA reductase
MSKRITGFSKLNKAGKIKWIVKTFFNEPETVMNELMSYWHSNEAEQKIIDGFSENTISNFILPFGVAPNFIINEKVYCVPMVIEESSVVAAASSAAKFWADRGGFKAQILGTKKIGQLHFKWPGKSLKLRARLDDIKEKLLADVKDMTSNMEQRGGGVKEIELLDFTHKMDNYYQLRVSFETCDSMGANFINSVLEQFGQSLQSFVMEENTFEGTEKDLEIIMAILSNFTPQSIVRVSVSCPIQELGHFPGNMSAETFAKRFMDAIQIAHIDPYRAATHNKGIFNGVDAVVLATGNDFRAIESCGHTYAAQDGYSSLSDCSLHDGIFHFWLDLPLSVGTVGGLTSLHPMAKKSLELLDHPTAEELMMIIAATGLAQNFAALRSLVTTGIQQGHMKMHLQNILNSLKANEEEIHKIVQLFKNETVSYSLVREKLEEIRKGNKRRISN